MFNAYCLADDLMEPFRPLVDRVVRRQVEKTTFEDSLTQETKEELIEPLLGRLRLGHELRTLFDVVSQLAASLVQFFVKEIEELELPALIEVYEEEKPF